MPLGKPASTTLGGWSPEASSHLSVYVTMAGDCTKAAHGDTASQLDADCLLAGQMIAAALGTSPTFSKRAMSRMRRLS